jgi:hypothetical protein
MRSPGKREAPDANSICSQASFSFPIFVGAAKFARSKFAGGTDNVDERLP